MHLALVLALFALGVLLIIKGGDWFVDAATWIAEVSGIPKFIVGATVVSVATTLPEIIVSLMAAVEGKADMAVGNAVGSVTVNTAFVLSLTLIFMTVKAPRGKYAVKAALLLAAITVLQLASAGGAFSWWGTVVLFIIFGIFIYENIRVAKSELSETKERPETDKKTVIINILKFAGGAAGIVIGSRLLVDYGSELARIIGVPERIIAVTMVAIGTSLPELVTTVTALVKKQSSLSVGNIIGANLIDIALILPLCSCLAGKEFPISATCFQIDLPACLIVTAVALVPTLIKERFYRWQGILMMLMYGGYMALTLTA